MMSLRKYSVADGLCLAAAPTFALMALLTAVFSPPDMMCMAPDGFAIGGMVPMYALMSAFHLGPWLKLLSFPSFQHTQGTSHG